MSLIAFVDGISARGEGAMMLEVEAKDKDDMEAIVQFIEIMNRHSNGMIQGVTVVNSSTIPVETPYVHPPLANKANPDDSFDLEDKTWFELIISVKF